MKKRWLILSVTVLILLATVSGVAVTLLREYYRLDLENHCLIVKKDEATGFSYAVYRDHVELLEYQGEAAEIDLPETLMGKPVTVIGEECFMRRKDITSVHLSPGIRQLGVCSFAHCSNLENVSGEAEVESIQKGAFLRCEKLKTVSMGNHIRVIGTSAFDGCMALESIGAQPELETIGDFAFSEVGSLFDFSVPEDTSLGIAAFAAPKWLERQTGEYIVLAKGVLVSYRGDSERVEVPEGIKRIDYEAFCEKPEMENPKEIYLPDTVEEISSKAFGYCKDTRVYIPASVSAIDMDHFGLMHDDGTLTIVTTSGTTAEAYAKEQGIPCEIVEDWLEAVED